MSTRAPPVSAYAGLLVGITILAGCGENQSALNPKGPEAYQIALLTWLLFALGAVVLALVIAATALALRGSDRTRRILSSGGTVVAAGLVFPIVTLSALLGLGVWLTRAAVAPTEDANAVHIDVVGEQWWWRIAFRRRDGSIVPGANELRIPTGRTIVLTLRSADVIHSFWVPNLAGKMDMIPGRTTQLRLRADERGVFRGQCAEYCGGPHALMALGVVAMPPAEFDTWLDSQARNARAPESLPAHRGASLFLAAGCGACHAVRGTAAEGSVGPDLTHLGSRRSVGIDTMAMSEASVARFIRDGQHVKPGNLMPPFQIFSDGDLQAIASYLVSLR
jgi:cytochrome c oxidase subunit II